MPSRWCRTMEPRIGGARRSAGERRPMRLERALDKGARPRPREAGQDHHDNTAGGGRFVQPARTARETGSTAQTYAPRRRRLPRRRCRASARTIARPRPASSTVAGNEHAGRLPKPGPRSAITSTGSARRQPRRTHSGPPACRTTFESSSAKISSAAPTSDCGSANRSTCARKARRTSIAVAESDAANDHSGACSPPRPSSVQLRSLEDIGTGFHAVHVIEIGAGTAELRSCTPPYPTKLASHVAPSEPLRASARFIRIKNPAPAWPGCIKVPRARIELATPGFSDLCSTN